MSVPTPPSTTLSTPSPTELHNPPEYPIDEPSQPNMATVPKKPIYLIVATALSPAMGIGYRNGLPWGSVRTDMNFFRKVTSTTTPTPPTTTATTTVSPALNAVIMGRKTWASIPSKFRPLPARINVIITRSDTQQTGQTIASELRAQNSSLDIAISSSNHTTVLTSASTPSIVISNSLTQGLASLEASSTPVDKIFSIGGAELYKQFLAEAEKKQLLLRIIQTQLRRVDGASFDCDTFFPVKLLVDEQDGPWKTVDQKTVQDWLGVELPQGNEGWKVDEKAGVEVRVVGWAMKE